jgi:alkyldihydroxyacetonephosphate synthase
MSNHSHENQPNWYGDTAPQGTYRSLFKWGSLSEFKRPNHRLIKLVKETFHLTDADFQQRKLEGLEQIDVNVPMHLSKGQLDELRKMVGEENVRVDTVSRIRASYGKGMVDALRLRHHQVENLPDAVIAPRGKEDVAALVSWCNKEKVALYVWSGGSSVTRGSEAVKGGITLDMSVHMNRMLSFNEIDQTITVEPGMSGPALEALLNNAKETLKAKRGYTCGHFPQSFEYSSVGGWVVTRGAGQNSTYYGKIEDIVISQEYITPIGEFRTYDQPRAATGPDFDQIMIGSEGTFGVLVAVTLRVFRHLPEGRYHFSYMFKTWEDAQAAVREVMQGEFGYPSVCRLSDPEETDVAMKLYGIEGTPAETVLNVLGFKRMQKCLLLGSTDGEPGFCRHVARKINQIASRYQAFNIGAVYDVTKAWEKDRFRDPYMREDLGDFEVVIDTLECGVTWAQLHEVHRQVRAVVKERPETICMTHLSHCYPQGGNLYFIFIARMKTVEEYLELQYSILEAIQKSGASMSHHHGMGKQTAPWFVHQVGAAQMDVLRTLKEHFDPKNIMNPGGTLGLDMSDVQRRKRWGIDKK